MDAGGLSVRRIDSVSNASAVFGANAGLMIALPGRDNLLPWFTVPSGFFAVVTRFGRPMYYTGPHVQYHNTPIWPPGFHAAFPFDKVAFLVTQQAILYESRCWRVMTRDNVCIRIDVVVAFRVSWKDLNTVADLAMHLHPDDFKIRLHAQVDQSVRLLVRSIDHTEAYGLRSIRVTLGSTSASASGAKEEKLDMDAASRNQSKGASVTESMKRQLNDAFNREGIEVIEVVIKRVILPQKIQHQLASKTKVSSVLDEQKMQNNSTMAQTECNEEKHTLRQRVAEDVARTKQHGEREVADLSNQLNQIRADVQFRLNAINQHGQSEVDMVRTECESIRRLSLARHILAKAHATIESGARDIEVKTWAKMAKCMAKAQLFLAKKKAEADLLIIDAQHRATPAFDALRRNRVERGKLETLRRLARNEKLVISPPGTEANLEQLLVADLILKAGERETRAAVLAQLVVSTQIARMQRARPDGRSVGSLDTAVFTPGRPGSSREGRPLNLEDLDGPGKSNFEPGSAVADLPWAP